jgi:chemotaxis protein MotB
MPVALAMALAGCGVSKEIYQTQVVQSQQLEARAADLGARLQSEAARREALEEELASRTAEAARLADELSRLRAREADIQGQLGGCLEREAGLRADLDLARRARTAGEAAREAELRAWNDERDRLTAEVAALRARLEQAGAEIAALSLEKERLEREKREKLDEISRTYEGLVEGMKEEVQRGRVTISQLRGQLSVNLLDEILFDSGSATVKAEGREVLARVGQVLAGLDDKGIVIEGHTDDVRISGELARRFPTNWELSTARATSVVRYLQESAGIPPDRLSAAGFGPYRPVAPNDTPEGRARNRRIEIKLVPLESPLLRRPEIVTPEDAAQQPSPSATQ